MLLKILYISLHLFNFINVLINRKFINMLRYLIILLSIYFFIPSMIVFCESDPSILDVDDQQSPSKFNYKKILFFIFVGISIAGLMYILIYSDHSNITSNILDNIQCLGTVTGDSLHNITYLQLDLTKNLIHYSNMSFNELLTLEPTTTVAVLGYVPAFDTNLTEDVYSLISVSDLLIIIKELNLKPSTHF